MWLCCCSGSAEAQVYGCTFLPAPSDGGHMLTASDDTVVLAPTLPADSHGRCSPCAAHTLALPLLLLLHRCSGTPARGSESARGNTTQCRGRCCTVEPHATQRAPLMYSNWPYPAAERQMAAALQLHPSSPPRSGMALCGSWSRAVVRELLNRHRRRRPVPHVWLVHSSSWRCLTSSVWWVGAVLAGPRCIPHHRGACHGRHARLAGCSRFRLCILCGG